MGGNALAPGLLPGLGGGVAYQLLPAHPEHDLPSILTPVEGVLKWQGQQGMQPRPIS